MVEVGESTGALADMLNSVADFYDEENETSLTRFSNLIQPLLLIVMGVVIAGLLLSLYMPLFQSFVVGRGNPWPTQSRQRPNRSTPSPTRVRTDHAAEEVEARRLAERYQLEFVDLEHFHIDHALFRSIPADLMLRYGFVPYRRDGQTLLIVVSDPSDLQTIDEVGVQLNTPIRVCVGTRVGDPVDPEEERELAARARGSHRRLPDADPARGRGGRREPDGRQADVGREPGHPARGLDGLHGAAAPRLGHPHRDAGRRGRR